MAVRQGDHTKAQVLGERGALLLDRDLAGRAFLAAARAAHLQDDAIETGRLCSLAIDCAADVATQVDALWIEFSSALERFGSDASDDPAHVWRAFKELERLTHSVS